jgi:hypothetical protein
MHSLLVLCQAVTMTTVAAAGPVSPPQRVVAQGATAERLQRAYGRMCAPPLSDLDFVLSDLSFKYKRRFTEYSGDISGRLLGALVSAGPVLGQDSVMVAAMLEALPGLQKADGHFGADEDLAAGIQMGRDTPILWGNSRLLLALVQRYEQRPDPQVLEIARKVGDWVVNTRQYFGKPENMKVGGAYAAGYTTCYPALIEGMARLGGVTRDSRYFEEARFIAGIALTDTSFDKHHSHGRLASYRGMLEVDRVSGKPEFLPRVQAGVAKVAADLVLPTGGVTELFDRTDTRDEGCSEVDWIMANVLLWRATGQPSYLDMAEFTLRNHVWATQFPNGGFGHHTLRTLRSAGRSWLAGGFANVGAEAYWCCSQHGTQMLGDLARCAVMSEAGRILVTWMAEVRATLNVNNRPVIVSILETAPGTWIVEVEGKGAGEVPLRLRVPAWAREISVNGKAVAGARGWAEVTVSGDKPQKLEVQFPSDIRLLGAYGSQAAAGEPQRIAAGPDLYCLPDAHLPVGFGDLAAVPVIRYAAGQAVDGQIPVVVSAGGGGDGVRTSLVPMSRRPAGGCRFLFKAARGGEAEISRTREYIPRGIPIELLFACDGQAEVFLNGRPVASSRGWGENGRVEVYGEKGLNVVTVRMSSKTARPGVIGMIRAGNQVIAGTSPEWVAAPCPAAVPAEWLTDPAAQLPETVRLADVGGFGQGPWTHMPAEFAGTDARWIWPDAGGTQGDFLLRRVIELR